MVLGILLAYYLSISLTFSLYASIFLALILFIIYTVSKYKKSKSIWFGLISYVTITSLGILITNLNNEKLSNNHYLHSDSSKIITFRISSILKPGNYNDKYIIDVVKIDDKKVFGKALLNIKKDSIGNKLKIDAVYITREPFQEIKDVVNPNQFDYKTYLERQYIYKQLYTSHHRLFNVSTNKSTLFGYANFIRENINNKLKNYAFTPDELAIINALLLGQRQDLSDAVKSHYINSGAIHILAVSGLHVGILLFLFDVGFQLSYLAVFSIVSIQPLLVKYWQPKYYIPKKLWEILTVTIAAQLGVLPISLFYFHQIPSLFFIANLIIIPFLGPILGLGIFVIILALINALPSVLVEFYGGIISAMNSLMQWVSHQEVFLFKDISFNLLQVISAYLLIISVVKLLAKKNYKWLRLTLVSVLIIQSISIINKHSNSFDSFTIFHKSRFTVIGEKSNSNLKVYSNLDSLQQFSNLNDYAIGNNINHIKTYSLQPLLKINNQYLFIIDSIGTYNIKGFKPDYVLVRNSPKINIKRVIDSIKPYYIIADGSNYKSYVMLWKASCEKEKIPFHYTGEKGAFIIE